MTTCLRTHSVAPNRAVQFLDEFDDGTLCFRDDHGNQVWVADPETLGKLLTAIHRRRIEEARAQVAVPGRSEATKQDSSFRRGEGYRSPMGAFHDLPAPRNADPAEPAESARPRHPVAPVHVIDGQAYGLDRTGDDPIDWDLMERLHAMVQERIANRWRFEVEFTPGDGDNGQRWEWALLDDVSPDDFARLHGSQDEGDPSELLERICGLLNASLRDDVRIGRPALRELLDGFTTYRYGPAVVAARAALGLIGSPDDRRLLIEDSHPEARCQRCGTRNIVWAVDSEEWNKAAAKPEVLCPACFGNAHFAATGVATIWHLNARPVGG